MKQYLESGSSRSEQAIFNEDLCKALVTSNIPLIRLNNPNLRSFLQKYCKFNIPEQSILRKRGVDSLYIETREKIREITVGNHFYIIVDETTDSCGRYIAHLMIGSLREEMQIGPYLIASKQLDKTNNLTITRFIQTELSSFFLPEAVPTEKCLLLLSDAAPYMVKAAQNLKMFYENLIHVTCLAHGLNRVAEEIRSNFPLINDLISNVKKIFLKAPLRTQLYKEKFPELQMPPEPVITRWGTWLKAAFFYADNYEKIKEIIFDFDDSSKGISNTKKLFQNHILPKQLVFLKNYAFVPKIILDLEQKNLSLVTSVNLIKTFESECKNVQGDIGKTIFHKFSNIILKNEGFIVLRNLANIYSGNFEDINTIHPDISGKFKFAPITSVDVERSFSLYKYILTDRRQSFNTDNLEKHLIVHSFYNNVDL